MLLHLMKMVPLYMNYALNHLMLSDMFLNMYGHVPEELHLYHTYL